MVKTGSYDQPIQNSYILDWWLVLGRQLTNHRRNRGALTLPKRIATLADLTDYIRVEPTDDADEQYVIRSSSEYYGVSTSFVGRNETSVQIPFPESMLSRIPFELGETIALELDMRTPSEGLVLREYDEYDENHSHSLSTSVLANALNTWMTS